MQRVLLPLLVGFGILSLASGFYLNYDKEYAILKVDDDHFEYFDYVDCSSLDDSLYTTGLYYEGTPCENVSLITSSFTFGYSKYDFSGGNQRPDVRLLPVD